MPNPDNQGIAIPRKISEGTIPLISVAGTAYECGLQYAERSLNHLPGYRGYLDLAWDWANLSSEVKRLVEDRAPHLPDLYAGIREGAGPPQQIPPRPQKTACTSFGVSGSVTLDGQPVSGQTKDTSLDRVSKYIVLRMRIKEAPTILVLCYPGEVLGYGTWSTGMSIFRNSLYSQADAEKGLNMGQWGLLTLAGNSVHEGAELARKHGLLGTGNCLISDPQGESLSVEWNAGGVSIVPAQDGIATHANHPEGEETAPFEDYPDEIEKENSRYRMHGLWNLLDAERGRLTPQKALMCLANHTHYPRGICRHVMGETKDGGTTAAVVAEPTRGKLHVVRGNPCSNWPVTHTI